MEDGINVEVETLLVLAVDFGHGVGRRQMSRISSPCLYSIHRFSHSTLPRKFRGRRTITNRPGRVHLRARYNVRRAQDFAQGWTGEGFTGFRYEYWHHPELGIQLARSRTPSRPPARLGQSLLFPGGHIISGHLCALYL
jgi:hypothetical protein